MGTVVFAAIVVGFVAVPVVALFLVLAKRKKHAPQDEHHRPHGHHREGH